MKRLCLILILAAATVFAGTATPQDVYDECVRQMLMGTCVAQNDGAEDAPGSSMLISGVGRVPLSAYRDFTRLASPDPKNVAMCAFAKQKMLSDPGGPHDLIARALWTPR